MSGAPDGPTIHGVYDFWLGGGQHTRADRELARAIRRRFPTVPVNVRAAQDFHLRAARWAAERGVSRFVQSGHMTALRGGRNVHDTARDVNPAARVIYASADETAHEWARALLDDGDATRAVYAGGEGILGAPPVRAMLAEGKPVCVIAGLRLHFEAAEKIASRVGRLARALSPGSFLAVSVALPDGSPEADELAAMLAPARLYRHTAADVTAWLEDAGMAIVPPGVADVRDDPGRRVRLAREPAARSPGIIAGVLAAVP